MTRSRPTSLYLPSLFSLLILCGHVAGQRNASTFSFDHLTVDDGLSYTTVHALLEDQLGMIWAGTRFGLNRFDGYEFKVFLPDPKNPYAIKSQSILTLWNDEAGNIWIGHLNGGVSVLERTTGRFLRFPFKEDNTVDWNTITVRSIFQDSRGNLWLGTYNAGTIVFDREYKKIAHFCTTCAPDNRRLNNDFVFDFQEDPSGRIWIGTAGKGISLFDWSTDSLHTIHSEEGNDMDGFAKSLCLGTNGNLWVGTEGSGLYEIDLQQLKVIDRFLPNPQTGAGLSNRRITDLVPDAHGKLWIATDGGGLNYFDPSTDEWKHYGYQPAFLNSLNSDALYDLMFDSSNNLWIGTFNGGINLHKTIFPPFVMDRQYALERLEGLRSVLCLDQDKDGNVWLGTDGGGLFQLDVRKNPVRLVSIEKSANHPPGLNVITSLVSLPDGNLWLGTFARGLYLYKPGAGIVKQFQNIAGDLTSLSHNNVWDLELAPDGGLWIGTLGAGVSYLKPGQNTFMRFQPDPNNKNSISGTQVIDILLDKTRPWLWIATENNGLSRIDHSTTPFHITQYHHNAHDTLSLSSEKIRCLYQDEEGTIWIGTENAGLNAYQPANETFHAYSVEDGLPSNMINSIVQGPQGYLWITTQAGIVRWNKKEGRFIKVGSEPFLENNQYNPGAALRLNDGRLILGSTNGYSFILPDQVRENTSAPKVVFTEFSLSNQSIPIGLFEGRTILSGPLNDSTTIVRFSYLDKGIQFSFTTTDYSQPDKNQFAYRLMGFDTTWRFVGPKQRFANYSSLPGGEYILEVKASNSDGAWNTAPRTLKIIVSPPFWTTWWFILATIGAGVIVVLGMIQFLLNRQKLRFRQHAMAAEQEILRLQNENLEKDILNKQAQLSASVLQSAHKNQFLEDLKGEIRKIETDEHQPKSRELHRLTRSIENELTQKNYWDQFQLTFNQVHQDFVHKLHLRHPHISATESRLCCFIRMGFSNTEIAAILNITVNGVEQSKYRLKKKLELEKDGSLNEYIGEL